MEPQDKIVYFHTRNDTGAVFYVGIGNANRPARKGRNRHWHNIVNKHGYEIVIAHEGLTWAQACDLERYYIRSFRAQGLKLVNMTDGGDGVPNPPAEVRERIAESKKAQWEDPEFRAKMSKSVKAQWEDPEYRARLAEARKAMWEDPAYRARISEAKKAMWADPKHRAKRRLTATPEEIEKRERKNEREARRLGKYQAAAQAEAQAAAQTAPAGSLILTTKGSLYCPEATAKVRGQQNVETWGVIKGALTAGPVTAEDLGALVPEHKSFIGYAIKSGWVARVGAP